jgi:hypothetical protein
MLSTLDDWITLSNFVKDLTQTGVVNFDVISYETLFTVILSEFSNQQIRETLKDWNIREQTEDRTRIEEEDH